MSIYTLNELADKYYSQLQSMLNDLASKCSGGEEATLVFPVGKVTIKLK